MLGCGKEGTVEYTVRMHYLLKSNGNLMIPQRDDFMTKPSFCCVIKNTFGISDSRKEGILC